MDGNPMIILISVTYAGCYFRYILSALRRSGLGAGGTKLTETSRPPSLVSSKHMGNKLMHRLFSPISNSIYRDGLVQKRYLGYQASDLYQVLHQTTSDQQIIVPAKSAGPLWSSMSFNYAECFNTLFGFIYA